MTRQHLHSIHSNPCWSEQMTSLKFREPVHSRTCRPISTILHEYQSMLIVSLQVLESCSDHWKIREMGGRKKRNRGIRRGNWQLLEATKLHKWSLFSGAITYTFNLCCTQFIISIHVWSLYLGMSIGGYPPYLKPEPDLDPMDNGSNIGYPVRYICWIFETYKIYQS